MRLDWSRVSKDIRWIIISDISPCWQNWPKNPLAQSQTKNFPIKSQLFRNNPPLRHLTDLGPKGYINMLAYSVMAWLHLWVDYIYMGHLVLLHSYILTRTPIGLYLWKRNGWFIETVQADVIANWLIQKKRLCCVKCLAILQKQWTMFRMRPSNSGCTWIVGRARR